MAAGMVAPTLANLQSPALPGYPSKFTYPSIPPGGNEATMLGPGSMKFSVRHENMAGTISGTADAPPVMAAFVPTSAGTREYVDLGHPVLNLQNNQVPQVSIHACSQKYGADAVRNIFMKLEERQTKSVFEEINLSDTALTDEGAEYLSQGLDGNVSLKTLLLPRSGIRTPGFQSIGKLLATLPNLEMLVLSGNLGDPESVAGEFKSGLSSNTSLKSICLAACRLGNKGVQELCEGPLRSHPQLEHISLNYNRLEDDVCSSVSKMMAINKTLEYLELCGNSIGAAGAKELVSGLIANGGKLRRLGLAQNNLRFEGSKSMCEHFMSTAGESLVYLDLRHNITTYQGHIELRKMLKKPYDDDATNKGWMISFGERQLMLNAL
eukprot:TRINITY_DN44489_c0_g1_i1.p1 TRINITY_DN44489_c0_g1~~TRINITY_DN44489_c0_g1_i1.p1  ORF type:complete len:380 (-),score=70.16 TRINITY_DN44489_c0_g1_i1:34-1173(-)